jgi:hypothetical protein
MIAVFISKVDNGILIPLLMGITFGIPIMILMKTIENEER